MVCFIKIHEDLFLRHKINILDREVVGWSSPFFSRVNFLGFEKS